MRRLATMEVERETTEMVELFFRHLNKALAKHVKDPNYKFNPTMIMTDEAGANFQGLKNAFGPNFSDRIITCQWHWIRCGQRQLAKIDESDRKSFMEAVHHICKVMTVGEYKKWANILEDICIRNKCTRWYNWWKARWYHLVPAL